MFIFEFFGNFSGLKKKKVCFERLRDFQTRIPQYLQIKTSGKLQGQYIRGPENFASRAVSLSVSDFTSKVTRSKLDFGDFWLF